MQKPFTHGRQVGFTLIELLVSMVIGALLVGSLFQLWNNNLRSTYRIQKRGDFRDAATLATTQLNHSIMMAGFGMSKMEVMVKATSDSTDTLTLYSNTSEIRTTLRDTAREFAHEIVVFKDTGFVIGSYIGAFLANALNLRMGEMFSGWFLGNLIVATVGAIVLLFVVKLVRNRG